MNNPFSGSLPPVKRRRNLVGRSAVCATLEDKVKKRQNTVIMGPEGIGKSSLLNCFFDRSFRIRMAQEENLLIARTSFPVHLLSDEVYHLLSEAIVSSLELLTEIGAPGAQAILQKAQEKRNCATGASRLEETCKIIDDKEYDITLVIDNFENFTSSMDVSMDHHARMRDLIKGHMISFVVATDYDFNEDSLPPGCMGSFLLMEFSGNELPLDGFDVRECREYLDAQCPLSPFSDADIQEIATLSGGIPALLRLTAEAAWEQKQRTPIMDDDAWNTVLDQLYYNAQVRRYMTHWCRLLSVHQIAAIQQLLNGTGIITGEFCTQAAKELHLRRLLTPIYRNGQKIDDGYDFNSIVLMDYCNNNKLITSDPFDVQRENIAEQLKEMIEAGQHTEVLALMQDLSGRMDNVTIPFDFNAELTDEILFGFSLNNDVIHSFTQEVQDLLVNGIRMERTFIHVRMPDYAPVYILFAKAIECHLNLTIVPILRKVLPNHKQLHNTTHTLMLGPLLNILKTEMPSLRTTVCREAAQFCNQNGGPCFDESWWIRFSEDLYSVKEIRNDMPHVTPLSEADGATLLHKLFMGEDSFMSRCTCVHNAVTL